MTDSPSSPDTRGVPGYSPLAKALHWMTFVLMVGQFALGYLMEVGGSGRGRGRGRGDGPGRGRGRGGDEALTLFGENRLLTAHVVLGLSILTLTLVRLEAARTSQ